MTNFDDIKDIKRLDKSDMLDILLDLPLQCKNAAEIADSFKVPPAYKSIGFDEIFFTGLGGSAIGGDIVKTYLSAELDKPIIVNRNYDVPAFVDKKTLAFVSSYSGNTEETLSAYKQIKAKVAKIIIITSGGVLYEHSKKDKIPSILVPKGIPPRTAIGYMSLIPLIVLSKLGLVKKQDAALAETIKVLAALKKDVLSPAVPSPTNIAKEIASKIYDRHVIVYGAEDFLGGIVTRWRQELQENSKIICSSAVLPEMNHNEITGWEDPRHISKDFAVIILRDKDEHLRVSRRIEISKDLIKRRAENIIEVGSRGESLLARTFSLIYIGTFVSFYLAILNDIDPTPVNNVTYLKKQLALKS